MRHWTIALLVSVLAIDAHAQTTASTEPLAAIAAPSPPPVPAPNAAAVVKAESPSTKPGAEPSTGDQEKLSAEDEAYMRKARAFDDTLTKRTGIISLIDGKVSLNVPAGYYYLGPEDSRRVIVDAWGNPPDAATGVHGMLFPADANPMLDAWGATIQYADDGFVSDKDAEKIDYNKLLSDMRTASEAENQTRVKDGYGALHLLGWAETPTYDKVAHKMYWAEELQFNDEAEHTLNYKIRLLGREGVLVINFVSSMQNLRAIKAEAPAVMEIPAFTKGHTYTDHAIGDREAEYGLAGLVAGGLGLAAAKKFGLLALIAAFGKKFIVLIVAGLAALGGGLKKMFGGRKPEAL